MGGKESRGRTTLNLKPVGVSFGDLVAYYAPVLSILGCNERTSLLQFNEGFAEKKTTKRRNII